MNKRRAWSVHEVLQTSNMDCGPAALAAWLSSSRLPISYARLREACQTDVDGTSIDAMEELANALGMPVEQVMVPCDSLFDPALNNLPCIAVVLLPNRLTHFVVLWRELFGWVQIMDPVQGKVWLRKAELQRRLYEHETPVPSDAWLQYAQGEEFGGLLQGMARDLGLPADFLNSQLAELRAQEGWQPWAHLDAALRCAIQLQLEGIALDAHAQQRNLTLLLSKPEMIPAHCWQVSEAESTDVLAGEGLLNLRGAVLLRRTEPRDRPLSVDANNPLQRALLQQNTSSPNTAVKPLQRLWTYAEQSAALILVGCSLLVGLLAFVEALIFRALVSIPVPAGWLDALLFCGLMLTPLVLGLGLLAAANSAARSAGRQLELKLRSAILQHLPLIPESYFASRLINDLAERGHSLALLGRLPLLLQRALILAVRLLGILVGLWVLLPSLGWAVGVAGVAVVAIPLAAYGWLRDLDLRVRTHASAAGQIYLDALRGSEAIAAHGAQQPLEFESESRFKQWHQAYRNSGGVALLVEVAQLVVLLCVAVLLVNQAIASGAPLGLVLLVAYWSLFLPIVSRQLMLLLRELPNLSNVAARAFEILDAPQEITLPATPAPSSQPVPANPVALRWQQVRVNRAEQPVLHELNLRIDAGERVAIVGQSGSGKSSFLSVLQGWLPLQAGQLFTDGALADAQAIAALREHTVVVDAQLYLWNRALIDNLLFGHQQYQNADLELAIRGSQLQQDLAGYPMGLAQPAGENGSRLSGGEAQRLRIGRALLNPNPRLVLLDEPFIGMNTQQRSELRQATFDRWSNSTVLFVVHDLQEVMQFDRVLVFSEGRIIEDGQPIALARDVDSAFAGLIRQDGLLRDRLFSGSTWQSLALAGLADAPGDAV